MKEKEVICEVVADLLPLYVEEAVAPETAEMIEEHIKGCNICRNCMEEIKRNGEISPESDKKLAGKRAGREIRHIFAEALSKVSDIARFVPLFIYFVALAAWILMEFQGIKYPHIRFDNWQSILCLFAYEIIIPCGFLIFCFWKSKKIWKKIASLIVTVVCAWYLIMMSIAGMFMAGTLLCNYTEDVADYREVIADTFMYGEYAILPETIPEATADVTFEYESLNTWDISYRYELKLRFTDEDAFEAELERLQNSQYRRNMYEETKDGEIHFVRHHGSSDAVCYFDNATMEMYYRVSKGE